MAQSITAAGEAFWREALPLIRAIDVGQLLTQLALVPKAVENPMAHALHLNPAAAAYVQVLLALRKIDPELWLDFHMDRIYLNPLESAAAILESSSRAQDPGLQRFQTAALQRFQLCLTARGAPRAPFIEILWSQVPFINGNWVCTKYIPPSTDLAFCRARDSLLGHYDPATHLLSLIVPAEVAESVTAERSEPAGHVTAGVDLRAPRHVFVRELLGHLGLLFGEALFQRFTARGSFKFLAACKDVVSVPFVPLSHLRPLLQAAFAVLVCPRCGLTSDNIRFEGAHCQFCAAFQENIARAITQPSNVPILPEHVAALRSLSRSTPDDG